MRLRKLFIFVMCAILCFPLVACNKDVMLTGDEIDEIIGSGVTYTVKFDIGDAARTAGVEVYPKSKKVSGGKVDPIPQPTYYPGFTFMGWFDANGNALTSATKITADITYTARWKSTAQVTEEAKAYEAKIASWAKPGHVYIHYKNYAHVESEQTEPKPDNNRAPNYTTSLSPASTAYGDWGLWCWAKNFDGRMFYPAWIDESGAVFDVKLDQSYNDAGWDGKNKQPLANPVTINYKEELVLSEPTFCTQIFRVSTRTGKGFWENDGSDNFWTLDTLTRPTGDAHLFFKQGQVASGSGSFVSQGTEPNPYADDDGKKYATRTTGDDIIDSSQMSKYPKIIDRVQGWDDDSVGYQIFMASFADSDGDGMGDIRGIINKLDYLKGLNVDVLWLTPFQSSKAYHSYDIKDYFSVDPRFGTLADYRELVYKVHQKGMKIVLDFVLNHTSQANPWFVKSQNLVKETVEKDGKTVEIDYRQFYNWIDEDKFNQIEEQDKNRNDKFATQWTRDMYGYYFYSSFSADLPELNFDYQPVRDAILDVCEYWLGFGLDGFRLDAVKHIYMLNEIQPFGKKPTDAVANDGLYSHDWGRNLNFYREFNYKLKTAHPNAFLVGENFDGNVERTSKYYEGIDSQFSFQLYYSATQAIAFMGGIRNEQGEISNGNWATGFVNQIIPNINTYKSINGNYVNGAFTSNHDVARARDRMNMKDVYSNIGSFYTNNTIDGNAVTEGDNKRPAGTLDTVAADKTEALLRLYYALQLTMPGITWIYYGDEIGMSGVMQYTLDTNSANTLTSGPHEDRVYRQPMKWKAQGNAEFNIGYSDLKAKLVGLNVDYVKSVEEQEEDENSLLNFVKKLTALRREYGLGKGVISDASCQNGVITYTVTGSKGKVKVQIGEGSSVNSGFANGKVGYYKEHNGRTYGVCISAI